MKERNKYPHQRVLENLKKRLKKQDLEEKLKKEEPEEEFDYSIYEDCENYTVDSMGS